MQVHQGNSVMTDADGSRKATLLFPAGTTATMVMSNGSTQPLATMHVRATEFTVGTNGPLAMPGQLPPASAYTFAAEFSADEAIAAGATKVTFNQPVIMMYVENFLNFPVGTTVPSGFYSRAKGQWVPAQNGLVIKIVSITGGAADLDVTGDGIADTGATLTNLGINSAEQQQLATLYAAGQSLWRVPVDHFTPWDSNWPYTLPLDAQSPAQNGANATPDEPEQDSCEASGSIIECQNQMVGERVGIVGTPYTLNYRSDRVPGHLSILNLKLGGPSMPSSLLGIRVRATVGGQTSAASFRGQPQPDRRDRRQPPRRVWTHDAGRPADHGDDRLPLSRHLPGCGHFLDQPLRRIRNPAYRSARIGRPGSSRCRKPSRAWPAKGSPTRARSAWAAGCSKPPPFLRRSTRTSCIWARARAVVPMPSATRSSRSAAPASRASPATAFPPCRQRSIREGALGIVPDGALYFCNYSAGALNYSLVRRITQSGFIATIAGSPNLDGFNGDNILATNAHLSCGDLAVAPDFSIYVSDLVNRRVRRITQAGIISTVAGNGTNMLGAEGVPANQTGLVPNRVAVGPEGNLYIAEQIGSVTGGATLSRIRRVAADGLITTLVTCPTASCGLAGMAVGPDGSLYYVDHAGINGHGTFIRRMQPAEPFRSSRARAPAITVSIPSSMDYRRSRPTCAAHSLTIGPDETIYFGDADSPRIAQVKSDGIMSIVAGVANGSRATASWPVTHSWTWST